MSKSSTPNQRSTRSSTKSNTPDLASQNDIGRLVEVTMELRDVVVSLKQDMLETRASVENLNSRMTSFEQTLSVLVQTQKDQQSEIEALKKSLKEVSAGKEEKNLETLEIMSEIEDRLRRRSKVIITGVDELASGSTSERQAHDENRVTAIMKELNLSISVTQSVRIGQQRSEEGRLLKVTLDDEESRTKLLRNAKSLRTSPQFKRVFINPDRTPKEQMLFRESYQELRQRRAAGEDVVYYRGTVMKRSEISRKQQNFR